MAITLSLPLSVARTNIVENSDLCTIVRESLYKIEFLMKANDETSFLCRIQHELREEAVLIGMQDQQKFANSRGFSAFSKKIDRCFKEVLERGEGALAGYVLPAYDNRIAVLQYVISLQYKFLSDEEYVEQLGNALGQCSKAMSLISSIVDDLLAAGRVLSYEECKRSAYRGCSHFVPPVSAELAKGRPN